MIIRGILMLFNLPCSISDRV